MSFHKRAECSYPGCMGIKLIKSRGLCARHWYELSYRIERGETTWEDLERDGLAIAPYSKSKRA